MISLRRRDASKELGLGFGTEVSMEDTELEEGEACSLDPNFNNNINDNNLNNDDASYDPDIALSYLDVKLQNVLGHFQKDFEGGVSAENLGAKFGGYGSFLPTHQRSPVWSHPRTPPKNQNYNAHRSPNNTQLEGNRRGSVSSSTAPQPVKHESASVSKAASSPIVAVRQGAGLHSSDVSKDRAVRHETLKRKATNLPDHKSLKVRIKVGSDNLSTKKNAAIYSGLGLDVSPSSSLDDSPSGSEGMSHGLHNLAYESPAHILQIMTSFPVSEGIILSPLPDYLVHLTEKVKPRKGDRKILAEKKIKSLQRNETLMEPKIENSRDSRGGVDVVGKEVDLDTLACEDLVSNTLKLPLLSKSFSVSDGAKSMARPSNVSREMSNGAMSDTDINDPIRERPLGPISNHEDAWVERPRCDSSGKDWEDKKFSCLDSAPGNPRKDGHRKAEKLSAISDSNMSKGKGMKTSSSELADTEKQKVDQKLNSKGQERTKLPSGKERASSDKKKRLKGSQVQANIIADTPKNGLMDGSSSVAKNKNTSSDEYAARVELENSKLPKITVKPGDKYSAFFGDLDLDQEENQMSPPEMSGENRRKEPELGENRRKESELGENSGRFFDNSTTLKERSIGKKSSKHPTTELHPRPALTVTLSRDGHGDGRTSDVSVAEPATASAQDLWVCCDKCQKWRLLPPGKTPEGLPEKWHCSMLDWVPGLNRCSLPEPETTKVVMEVYNMVNHNLLPTNPGGDVPATTVFVDQHDQNHQDLGVPSGIKKKASKDATSVLSSSMKKNLQASAINGCLNEVNQPSVSETDALNLSKNNGKIAEKYKHRQKEKHKVLDNLSDGGDTRPSKLKGKRNLEEDLFGVSKKIKTEGLPEDWVSDHVNSHNLGPSSSHGLPAMPSGKSVPKNYGRASFKDQSSARTSKEKVPVSLDDVPTDMRKGDDREGGKKRKVKGSYDTQINMGPTLNVGPNFLDSRIMAKEEFSDSEYRKEKKARVSRSEGKESSASKGSGKADRKVSHRKNYPRGKDTGNCVPHQSLDGVDFSKRDSGSLHPSVAATSSSSKVSGSQKTKASFHETKGSPVESVSSSPLRVPKQGKIISVLRNFTDKDDSSNAGIFAQGGQQRCSDGEDDGGSERSGTAKKEKTPEVAHHGSHESSVLDFQDKDFSRVSGCNAKQQILPSPDVTNHHLANGGSEYLGQETRYCIKTSASDQCNSDGRQHENQYHVNGSRPRKCGKGSSSRSKDKNRNFIPVLENGEVKVSDPATEQTPSFDVKPNDCKIKTEEKSGVRSDEGKKSSTGLLSSESSKPESQSKFRGHGSSNGKAHALCGQDATSTPKQTLLLDSEGGSGRVKSPSLPPSGCAHTDAVPHGAQPLSGSYKANGVNVLINNASDADHLSKTVKQIKKVDFPNGTNHSSSKDPLSNGRRSKDLQVPSSVRRESSSQSAAKALKEAKDLKHLADRYKSTGDMDDSRKYYFESALKFLHGASLLEISSSENPRSGDYAHSMQVYSSTAKLCEFCAHEYEKCKNMAAAALAYKCMEVAHLRVVYNSHNGAIKDRHELQNALQMVPPGESPSSSASDVDNLIHPAIADRSAMAKTISSPQVTGSNVNNSRNRMTRVLNFIQDVYFAMEASKKSRAAFAAASKCRGETQCKEALDFSFQDVDGLLRLVRVAMEAISPPNS